MKTILCYGDSNTWGADPVTLTRFDRDTRWPGVLRNALGAGYEIIEEGLSGRTTDLDDSYEPGRNGKEFLFVCLDTHRPIDLVIIMLGTNDLKKEFNRSPREVAIGAGGLVKLVFESRFIPDPGIPRVLLVCPPPFKPLTHPHFQQMMEGAYEKSFQLAQHYRQITAELGCDFLDAGEIIQSSAVDGFHLEASEHRKLGLRIADWVRETLG